MKELFNEFMDKMPSSLTHLIIVQTKADLQAIDPSELKDFLNISDIQKEVLVTAVSSMTGDGIQEITEWINLAVSKNDRKVSFEFEAEPRVVKSRGKYKINDQ
jgi:50S ribosomal subunit-associated GTPase HflX